jgi:hypothetical protein
MHLMSESPTSRARLDAPQIPAWLDGQARGMVLGWEAQRNFQPVDIAGRLLLAGLGR